MSVCARGRRETTDSDRVVAVWEQNANRQRDYELENRKNDSEERRSRAEVTSKPELSERERQQRSQLASARSTHQESSACR